MKVLFYVWSKIWPIFTPVNANSYLVAIPKKSRDPGIGFFPIPNPEIPIPIPKRQILVHSSLSFSDRKNLRTPLESWQNFRFRKVRWGITLELPPAFLPPRELPSNNCQLGQNWIFATQENCRPKNFRWLPPNMICHQENCPSDELPPGELPPRKLSKLVFPTPKQELKYFEMKIYTYIK